MLKTAYFCLRQKMQKMQKMREKAFLEAGNAQSNLSVDLVNGQTMMCS